ncbi:unnamed protein product [Phytophthora fragariaefolia]|uniref:Unnamed protein product n=1 Tax=Phytophthora fragariaefolia TaxID=1490495 RepID=A0A9W6Y553_9STRA|nr:unnamed protein product [Phytophthora fragariaefolia]
MADERLNRLLSRGEVPPPWKTPDAHIEYSDEDADSTVDATNADPDFELVEEVASDGSGFSSSEDESDGDVQLWVSSSEFKQSETERSRPSSRSRGSRRHKSILAAKDSLKFTIEELQTIEVPEDDEASWVCCGNKVQWVSSTKTSFGQTPGFPDYEPHQLSTRQVKERWDVNLYALLTRKLSWREVFRRRIRLLYFYRRSDLSFAVLKMLERTVNAMDRHARAF